MEGVRGQYLESVADDATGILLLLALGATGLGVLVGGGRAVEAAGGAVSRKRQPAG